MKILYIIYLSLHVLMLCLTFIKNAQGFRIRVEYFEIRRGFSKVDKDRLPEPLPLPVPLSQTIFKSFPSEKDASTESSDKTLSASQPTLNLEEEESLLHTTPMSTSMTIEVLITEEHEGFLQLLPFHKENNKENEHIGTNNDQDLAFVDEINDDSIHNGTQNYNQSYHEHGSIKDIEETENSTNSISTEDYGNIYANFNSSDTNVHSNITLDSNNKTETLSLRIFKNMFDPRRIDLVYFFGGVAAVISIVGALLLTKKLYKA